MCDIKKGELRLMFLVMLVAIYSMNSIIAQISQPAPNRQSSIDAFTKGNYEAAYNGFSQLLLKYPKDPLYKYYSGACLVMMKKSPDEAVSLLQQSVNSASVVKSLPPESLFYLGRAQQMAGKYSDAIQSFKLYTDQVGKKAAREQGVPGYIQECENKKGMVAGAATSPAISPAIIPVAEKAEMNKAPEQTNITPVTKKSADTTVSKREGLPPEYEIILDEALRLQYKSDSLNQLAGEQKKKLDQLPENEKSSLRMRISQNESLAGVYQKAADKKYSEAQDKMSMKQEPLPVKKDTILPVVRNEPAVVAETIVISEPSGKSDTVEKETVVAVTGTAVFSYFEILPKGAAYPDEKIKIDPVVPAGLIYRIQLAVFRNPVAPSYFKGLNPVYGFRVAGTDKTNYYAGMFRRSADAKKALPAVKETGFKDAFVVAMSDNKPVSADRAAVLEREWGMKSFADISVPGTTTDTIPPTLAFRVEVARSLKPLKPDALEALKAMAGSRGLDILHLSDGNNVYLIGKFITFESAAEYADLLVRNNYRGAKVVAWLGNKEVPVETARQLFNDLQ
jgi:tetratricopeptide (TPR) repeat protein